MDLSNGYYLGNEILTYSGNKNSMWLIVFDGGFNYMLFCWTNRIEKRYNDNRLPTNDIVRGSKDIEYYSSFDNAIKNLMKVIVNNRFK